MWKVPSSDLGLEDHVAQHFRYDCLLGLLAPVTDGLSMYVQEPLALGKRGCTGRDLNGETVSS